MVKKLKKKNSQDEAENKKMLLFTFFDGTKKILCSGFYLPAFLQTECGLASWAEKYLPLAF